MFQNQSMFLIGAGTLVVPKDEVTVELTLESFDISGRYWTKKDLLKFHVEKNHFAQGAFRNAYKAYTNRESNEKWVIKRFKPESWTEIEQIYDMSLVAHTRKQVQMHVTARSIAYRMKKKFIDLSNHELYGMCFKYDNIYFAMFNNDPVTVEKYVPGKFVKFVNNDGRPGKATEGSEDIYSKAETLSHFSYIDSDEKLMLVDLQGVGYRFFDPEIATSSEIASQNSEAVFCAGNLRDHAIRTFFQLHKCNVYCETLGLPVVMCEETELD